MIIISSFQDYYDNIAHQYPDRTVVYHRDPTTMRIYIDKKHTSSLYPDVRNVIYGSLFNLIHVVIGRMSFTGVRSIYGDTFWNRERAVKFCEQFRETHHMNDKRVKDQQHFIELAFGDQFKHTTEFLRNLPSTNQMKRIDDPTFATIIHSSRDHEFHNYKDSQQHPLWKFRGISVIRNPRLDDYDVKTICDPYTAFQEIYQYISGVLGGRFPETVEINDKELAKKKGFGHKYAFRKEPEK